MMKITSIFKHFFYQYMFCSILNHIVVGSRQEEIVGCEW